MEGFVLHLFDDILAHLFDFGDVAVSGTVGGDVMAVEFVQDAAVFGVQDVESENLVAGWR